MSRVTLVPAVVVLVACGGGPGGSDQMGVAIPDNASALDLTYASDDVGTADEAADDDAAGAQDPWVPQEALVVDDVVIACNPRTKLVYVSTEEGDLWNFDPPSLAFKKVGSLACGDPWSGSTPFSMAIDRLATAWILYDDGNLYEVSTVDASCKPTSFVTGQSGFDTFGMGFASDAPGSEAETLYVSQRNDMGSQDSQLGVIAFPSLKLTPVAPLSTGSAELTGNGLAELWGFFPEASPVALVARIDKATGALSSKFNLPAEITDVQDWAFAFWGGKFYVFFKSFSDPSSSVWELDPATGDVKKVVTGTGMGITGAGVSACAPVSAP